MRNCRLYILPLLFVCGVILTVLASCKEEKKSLIIPEDKMVDVLYDYHLTQAISSTQALDSATQQKYLAAMYAKYGINQEMMDSSMVYYLRHTDMMQDIYTKLVDKVNNESRLQGADNSISVYSGTSLNGDTANIWNKEQGVVLGTSVPNNLITFKFNADTTYHAGDRYILSFKSDFIYQDGTRSGLAVLQVKLKNDSVVTRNISLNSPNNVRLEIADTEREGVKQVSGFILSKNPLGEKPSSTIRMLIATNIQLLKIHTPEPIKQEENNEEKRTDSIVSAPKPDISKP